jgi:hypothetical protein
MKGGAIMRYKDVIEIFNVKHLSLEGIPTKLVFTFLPQSKGVKLKNEEKTSTSQ